MATDLAALIAANPSSYTSTDPGQDARRYRRRMAEALQMQALSGEPIRHWTQGMARVAQALVGGYEGHLADEGDRKAERETAATLSNLPGLSPAAPVPTLPLAGGGSAAPVAPPLPSTVPATPPRDPSAPMALRPLTLSAVQGAVTGDNPEMPSNWSAAERERAKGVNPMLLSAVARANDAGADLRPGVMGGVRDQNTQDRLVMGGRSTTRNSRHLTGDALDLWPGGNPNAAGDQYQRGADAMKTAAAQNGNPMTWGGDWRSFVDKPHFELGGRKPPLTTLAAVNPGTATDAPQPGANPPQVATAPTPPAAPQPAPAQVAQAGAIDPQMAGYIRTLMQNPRTRQYGMQLYQAAITRASQPQYGFQVVGPNLVKTDSRKGTAEVVPGLDTAKPTYGVIDEDQYGNKRYGWINPNTQSTTPNAAPKPAATGTPVVPEPPPGVDPKVWRAEQSKRATEDRMPADSKTVSALRKEVQDLPSYKNLAQAAPVYKSMLDAAKRDNRAADVNLIYGMAKIMDPGSVVRESEMTVAQAIATLPQQLKATVESQLAGSGRLSPEVRAGIMNEAHSRMGAYQAMYDQDASMFRGIAQRGRMDERDVLQTFGPFEPFAAPPIAPPPPAKPAAPVTGTTKSGISYKVY